MRVCSVRMESLNFSVIKFNNKFSKRKKLNNQFWSNVMQLIYELVLVLYLFYVC